MDLTLEDGRIIRLPDDVTDAEIAALARERGWVMEGDDEPASDPARSDVGAVMSGFGSRGPAIMLGAPVDLANMALEFGGQAVQPVIEGISGVPMGDIYHNPTPVAGSEWFMDRMEDVGIPARVEAETGTGRVLARMAEELGAAATGGIAGATGRLGALGQAMTEAPVTQGVASATAGLGAGLATEEAPGPYADLAGALLGGTLGAGVVPAARAAGGAVRAAALPFSAGGRERIVGDVLAEFGGARGDPTARALLAAQLEQTRGPIPASPITTPMAAMDPGISRLHRGLQNEGNGAYSRMLDEVLQERAGYRDTLANAMGNNQADPVQTGSTIRNMFQQGDDAMSDAVRRAYDAVDPNDTTAIPVGNIWPGMYDAMAGAGLAHRSGGLPPVFDAITQRYREGEFASWRQINADMIDLGAIASAADRAGQSNIASAANGMRRALDQALADAVQTGNFTPEQRQAYAFARALTAQRGRQFRDAPLGPILDRNFGEYRMAPESIGPTAFRTNASGGGQAMRQFGMALGQTPEAVNALRDHIMTTMRQQAGNRQGQLTGPGMVDFMARFRDALSNAPENLLTPQHRQALDAIARDLTMEQTAGQLGRATGSPTVQNLSIANLLRHLTLGTISPNNPILQPITPIARLLYRAPGEQIQQLLREAMIDPQMAAMMLRRPTADNLGQLGQMLGNRFGTTLGISTATTLPREDEQGNGLTITVRPSDAQLAR